MGQSAISCTDRRQASPEARPHRLTHPLNHETDYQRDEMYEQLVGVVPGALRLKVPSPC
jgi:hypothetical protein